MMLKDGPLAADSAGSAGKNGVHALKSKFEKSGVSRSGRSSTEGTISGEGNISGEEHAGSSSQSLSGVEMDCTYSGSVLLTVDLFGSTPSASR